MSVFDCIKWCDIVVVWLSGHSKLGPIKNQKASQVFGIARAPNGITPNIENYVIKPLCHLSLAPNLHYLNLLRGPKVMILKKDKSLECPSSETAQSKGITSEKECKNLVTKSKSNYFLGFPLSPNLSHFLIRSSRNNIICL